MDYSAGLMTQLDRTSKGLICQIPDASDCFEQGIQLSQRAECYADVMTVAPARSIGLTFSNVSWN